MKYKIEEEPGKTGFIWYRVTRGSWRDSIAYMRRSEAEQRRFYLATTPEMGA